MFKLAIRKVDNILLVMMIFLGVFSVRALLSSEFRSLSSPEGEPIAVISYVSQDVRTKGSSSLSWEGLQKESHVFHFDQIFTHEDSSVEIDFYQGPKVEVLERTLFRVMHSAQGNSIDLTRGMIFSNLDESDSSFVFTFGGQVYELTSSDADFQITSDGQSASVEVLQGSATLSQVDSKAPESESFDISSNHSASLDRDQEKISLNENSFSLIKPGNRKSYFSRSQKEVNFEYELITEKIPQDEINQFKLIVSANPYFENIVFEKDLGHSMNSKLFNHGQYYWKIVDEQGQRLSQIFNFSIKREKPLGWISPDRRRLVSRRPQKNVEFEWEDVAGSYRLQVLKENDQDKEILFDERINSNHTDFLFQNKGEYLVRVKVSDKKRPEAVWSKPLYIKMLDLTPSTPSLFSPENNQKIVTFDQSSQIRLVWRSIQGVDGYQVRLSGDFGEKTYEVTQPYYQFKTDEQGAFDWQVRSYIEQEDSRIYSDYSDRKQFKIDHYQFDPQYPEDGVQVELERPNQEVDFKWSNVQGAQSYILEVSRDQGFDEIEYTKTVRRRVETQIQVEKPGIYYWRTRAVNEQGEESFSRPSKVIFRPTPPPPRPDIEGKFKIEFLKSSFENRERAFRDSFIQTISTIFDFFLPMAKASEQKPLESVRITWDDPERSVKSYRIQIFDSEQLPQHDDIPFLDEVVYDNFFEWANPPREGKYYWRMAYIDYWDQQGPFSQFYDFEIKKEEGPGEGVEVLNLESIDLHSPYHGKKAQEQEPLDFRWSLLPERVQEEAIWLEFSRDLDFSSPDEALRLSPGQRSQRIPAKWILQIGESLYWRIRLNYDDKEFTSLRRLIEKSSKPSEKIEDQIDEKEFSKTIERPITEKKDKRHMIRGFYQLGKVDFEQTDESFEALVDGTSIMGGRIDYNYSLSKNSDLFLKFNNQSAKAFEDQDFVLTSFEAFYNSSFLKGLFRPHLSSGVFRFSEFSFEDTKQDLSSSTKNDFSLGVGASSIFSFDSNLLFIPQEFEAWFSYKALGPQGFEVYSFIHYKWMSLGFGVRNFDLVDTDINYQSFSFLLGHQFHF